MQGVQKYVRAMRYLPKISDSSRTKRGELLLSPIERSRQQIARKRNVPSLSQTFSGSPKSRTRMCDAYNRSKNAFGMS
jgi:hypothetical protein